MEGGGGHTCSAEILLLVEEKKEEYSPAKLNTWNRKINEERDGESQCIILESIFRGVLKLY